MKDELIKSNIKLSIGILVSNRINYIRKAMEGVKPLLEALPAELIALDTKGADGDGSIDIVREYTDKVYEYKWINDFADARNKLLEHASGEWFMFFDDDEAFDDVTELIQLFKTGEIDKYMYIQYYTRNYTDEACTQYDVGIAGRMFRRTKLSHFEGRVHEAPVPLYNPTKRINVFVHHYGYIFKNDEENAKHQERNVSLIKKELEESGKTPFMCAQLSQEYLSRKQTVEEGIAFINECLDEFEQKELTSDAMVQWMMVLEVRTMRADEPSKAIDRIRELIENYTTTQVGRLCLAGEALTAALAIPDIERVEEFWEIYIPELEWSEDNIDERDRQSNFGMPVFYSQNFFDELLINVFLIFFVNKKYEDAAKVIIELEKRGVDFVKYRNEYIYTLKKIEDKSLLNAFYRRLYKDELFTEENKIYLPKDAELS